ncbi:hypothetical protein EDC04DRAFT_2815087 [Pisolithus marmoratus]|nr:hypothetical protein EDC04DRAFT_2815087 [Pisolithus marmoratus]
MSPNRHAWVMRGSTVYRLAQHSGPISCLRTTTMPLPAPVRHQFEIIPHKPSADRFNGAYNKLFASLFPANTKFTVIPLWSPKSRVLPRFITVFVVTLDNKIIFMLGIMQPRDLSSACKREVADRQMRDLLADVVDCPIPTFYAASAMGTKLCFYSKDRNGLVTPPFICSDHNALVDVAPKERWDCDILEDDGAQRLQAVVEKIKRGCASEGLAIV